MRHLEAERDRSLKSRGCKQSFLQDIVQDAASCAFRQAHDARNFASLELSSHQGFFKQA